MEATFNGQMPRLTGKTLARKLARAEKPARRARKGLQYARKLAMGIGGIQTALLSLSVVHCTESIQRLTGSPGVLACLFAIGIDAGMVASEVSELAVKGRKDEQSWADWLRSGCDNWTKWARTYTIATVLASMWLNGYAFSQHAEVGMTGAAWALGALVPGLIYALGRVACGLWLSVD